MAKRITEYCLWSLPFTQISFISGWLFMGNGHSLLDCWRVQRCTFKFPLLSLVKSSQVKIILIEFSQKFSGQDNSNSKYMILKGWGSWLKRYLREASRGERVVIICFFYLARKTERKLVLAIDLNLMGWNSPKWKRPSFTISVLTQRRI